MFGSSRPRALIVAALFVAWQPVLVPVAHARPTCRGQQATIVGTKGPDRIQGTKADDVIVARGGPDLVRAGPGNDLICGGRGTDVAFGGGGDDTLRGQAGGDELFGGAGSDLLSVDAGRFQLVVGGGGDDLLVGNDDFVFTTYFNAPSAVMVDLINHNASGGHGSDTLVNIDGVEGSRFDDTLVGNKGINFIFGGRGNDSIYGGGNSGGFEELGSSEGNPNQTAQYDFLGGGPGDYSVTGSEGLDVVAFDEAKQAIDANLTTGSVVGEGSDTVAEVDIVLGSPFSDSFTGDADANGFEGYGGADSIDGQGGEDVAIYFDAKGVVANLAEDTATARYQAFNEELGPLDDTSTDSLTDIEDVWGSTQADTLIGDASNNQLWGLPGNDQLSGNEGDDVLQGGLDIDQADGGEGNDLCNAEAEAGCETSRSSSLPVWSLWTHTGITQLWNSLGPTRAR